MAENKSEVGAAPAASTESTQSGSFALNKIFDLTLLTQSRDGSDTKGKVYNYFWKKFDFRGGRKLEQL